MNAAMKPVTRWFTLLGAFRSQFRLILAFAICTAGVGSAGAVERVSVRPGGIQGNGPSSGPIASRFAECVAFYSDATNLLPNRQDSNAARDVFLFRSGGALERVSVASDGGQANGPSMAQGFRPAIDANCSCVAFSSDATNLVADDTNRTTDVFVHDLGAGTTERVSVGPDGEGNGASSFPSVDAQCGVVAFQSGASNLVAGDTNGTSDIFTVDRGTGAVSRVSVGAGGEEANGASFTPALSPDGRCVAFASNATNLLPGDTNRVTDIYVSCDGVVTCRASVNSSGSEANNVSFLPALSADGNLVAFKSLASNLVPGDNNGAADVFVHDCTSGETERVSVGDVGQEGNDNSFPASISSDGRFVAFGSFASNLLLGRGTGGNAQIYVRDRGQGTTLLISRNPTGDAANGSAPDLPPSITPDGYFVAFASLASDLVPGDTNGLMDAFTGGLGCDGPEDCPCPEKASCVDGQCSILECCIDADCPNGLICNDTGECVECDGPEDCFCPQKATCFPDGTCSVLECCFDTDCDLGELCDEGGNCICPANPVCPRRDCDEDADCGVTCTETSDCIDERCCPILAVPPDRTCVDGACTPADRCRALRCVPAPRPPCFTVEAVIDGFCECGGDCNLDGMVFGSEISTAINILTGLAPVEVCLAADINGDGLVMGDEVTLALSNLGQGCPDLLTPLQGQGLGQSRSGDVVTFEVGSAAGAPGQTVDVTVSVHGGAGELAMAQLDLVFDPSVLALPDPEAGCRLDGRLAGQILKVSYPDSPPAPPGTQRLRLFVGDLVLPLDTFADGPVMACTFAINADAPGGSTVLSAEQLNASDVAAGSFGTDWTAGAVVVDVPTPVPPPPTEVPTAPMPEPTATEVAPPPATPTAPRGECSTAADCGAGRRQACVDQQCQCVGDCNGDGSTVVSELVAAVRIAIGDSPSSACPAADANGSGGVSIDELLLGLNNLSRGCP